MYLLAFGKKLEREKGKKKTNFDLLYKAFF